MNPVKYINVVRLGRTHLPVQCEPGDTPETIREKCRIQNHILEARDWDMVIIMNTPLPIYPRYGGDRR